MKEESDITKALTDFIKRNVDIPFQRLSRQEADRDGQGTDQL